MNRDEILTLWAEHIGIAYSRHDGLLLNAVQIERFANLIAASERKETLDDLAASQAREAKLREALITVRPDIQRHMLEMDCSYGKNFIKSRADIARMHYQMVTEALDQPYNESAINQAVAKELRNMADDQDMKHGGIGLLPFELRRRANELENNRPEVIKIEDAVIKTFTPDFCNKVDEALSYEHTHTYPRKTIKYWPSRSTRRWK